MSIIKNFFLKQAREKSLEKSGLSYFRSIFVDTDGNFWQTQIIEASENKFDINQIF